MQGGVNVHKGRPITTWFNDRRIEKITKISEDTGSSVSEVIQVSIDDMKGGKRNVSKGKKKQS